MAHIIQMLWFTHTHMFLDWYTIGLKCFIIFFLLVFMRFPFPFHFFSVLISNTYPHICYLYIYLYLYTCYLSSISSLSLSLEFPFFHLLSSHLSPFAALFHFMATAYTAANILAALSAPLPPPLPTPLFYSELWSSIVAMSTGYITK